MEATSVTRKPEGEKKDMNGRGRRLSDLHDDVLIRILSFLSTKEAIQTSILSRRWQYLWTSIPILDFTHETDFMNFIQKPISLRAPSKITKLQLTSQSCAFTPPLVPWIWCNLEECELKWLNLPCSVCLPKLKMLKLSGVNFFSKDSYHHLFMDCPMLEHLHLECIDWLNVKSVGIFSSKLHRLIIMEAYYSRGLHIGSDFEIHARDLRYFSYSGPFYFDYCVSSSVLEDVTINAYPWNPNPTHVSNGLLRLLRKVCNVEKLILGRTCIPILTRSPEFHDMPKFTNLRHLELNARDPLDLMDEVWLKMLKAIPHLNRLVLSRINDSWLLRHFCLYINSSTRT